MPIAEDTAVLEMPAGAGELGAIFVGGFIGALLRAALTEALGARPAHWPWPTFAVNLAAAGLLGYAVAWLGAHHPRTIRARAFLATGVCGALSTFSTVMVELIHLDERSRPRRSRSPTRRRASRAVCSRCCSASGSGEGAAR